MLDLSVSYNRYKFLGHEFLTWLWFIIETDADRLKDAEGQAVVLEIGDRIVLENNRQENVETITIKGSESELEEGRLALARGAVVNELNLRLAQQELLWIFDIKGESLSLSGLKLPEMTDLDVPDKDSKEAVVLEKMELCENAVSFVHHLYQEFATLRISTAWAGKTVPQIKNWITAA